MKTILLLTIILLMFASFFIKEKECVSYHYKTTKIIGSLYLEDKICDEYKYYYFSGLVVKTFSSK